MWIVALSPLAIVFAMSFGQKKFSEGTLQAMFWGFAVLMGLSLSTIFLVYTGASIAQTFFATAAAFAGLSLWAYTTKKDLSGMGTFLIMGVIGLIVAMLLNAFVFQSGMFGLAISGIGVLIFAGLTAYDTQRLKSEYLAISRAKATNPAVAAEFPVGKMKIMGALSLYLDFINMFLFLLRFMGRSPRVGIFGKTRFGGETEARMEAFNPPSGPFVVCDPPSGLAASPGGKAGGGMTSPASARRGPQGIDEYR